MRVVGVLIASLVFALPAAAVTDRSVVAPANVTGLAAEGGRVAFLSAGANGGCGALRTWSPPGRTSSVIRLACGPRTSTGRGVYGLSLSGGPLWATYTGGNMREHTVWRRGRRIEEVRHDVDLPSPLLVGQHGAYAVGDQVTVVSAAGRSTWQLADRPLGLAAGLPYTVARLASGPVVLVDSSGQEASRFDYERGAARAARVFRSRVAVLRAGAIDVYSSERDTLRTWQVPTAASYGDDYCGVVRCSLAVLRLADLSGDLVVYVRGRELHVLRVTDGTDVIVRRPAVGPVHAQLEAQGLSYSAGKRVFFIPRRAVDRRLRSG
jgi:hypothetical protein